MSLINDVKDYESWLRKSCSVVEAGLCKKHHRMAKAPFAFFRATCFRFARQVGELFPELADAPAVPSVGDAHIENWGTWRDDEGRLVWGVNDFDEAAELPYTYDLLRLATSARLARGLPGTDRERAAAILNGYREGLAAPRPCFVDDEVRWMQKLTNRRAAKQGAFRKKLSRRMPAHPPVEVEKALWTQLPPGTVDVSFSMWQRGGGSLGRPRYLAIGTWHGGLVVREAKALVSSAWDWAAGASGQPHLFVSLATGLHRSPDPFLHGAPTRNPKLIVRRLAPDSAKINLSDRSARVYGPALLSAMGTDLASIHAAGSVTTERITCDLAKRDADWLFVAAEAAAHAVEADYAKWEAYYRLGQT